MGSPKKSAKRSVKIKGKSAAAPMAAAKKPASRTGKSPAQVRTEPERATAGDWFEKLVAIQKRLRDPGGCPWDIEQTHQTLRTYLIEEAYEVLDAIDSGEDAKFVEELGDLLLQVTFHSQIASETNRFNISDVIRSIHDKMIRRHPHVFGETRAKNSVEVLRNWEQMKAEERGATKESRKNGPGGPAAPSLLDGVSRALPATLEGFQLTRKAARIGFDWDDASGVIAKLQEETKELETALQGKNQLRIEEEMGDLLFAAVNLARFLHVDPEIALKKANAKFSRRFRAMEARARESGRAFKDLPRDEMEALWETTKSAEGKSRSAESSAGSARK